MGVKDIGVLEKLEGGDWRYRTAKHILSGDAQNEARKISLF